MTLLTVLLAEPATARRKRGRKTSIALFPVTGNHTGVVAEVNRLLEAAVHESGLDVITGPALKRRLRSGASQSVRRCLGNPSCIGKLARKARAGSASVGTCTNGDTGAVVVFQIINARGRVEREATIQVADATEARPALAGVFEMLFLEPPPPALSGAASKALAAMGDLALAPVEEDIALAPVEKDLAPAEPLRDPLEGTLEPLDAPLTLNDPLEDEPFDDDDDRHATELRDPLENDPLIEPTPDPTVFAEPLAEEPSEPSEWLFYTSIVVAGAGAAAAATGGYYGIQTMLTVEDANSHQTITQLRARELQQQADDYADTANLLYTAGGGVVALGAILFTLDLLLVDEVEPAVSVSADGASASLRVSF